ncbi:MAG: fluoride efflux transporter CrcB [Alphaproteobacteria bacterium]
MRIPIAVALGGAIGALARYLMVGRFEHWFGTGFPYGILAANVLGSFLMGVLIELMALAWSASPDMRALLTVGLLGSFTTFSGLSLRTLLLFEAGAPGQAALYALASVLLSLIGIFAGMRLFRVALS